MGQLFFDEESIYEISNPYNKICLFGQTDGRSDEPKAICPFNSPKAGGIKKKCIIGIFPGSYHGPLVPKSDALTTRPRGLIMRCPN